MSRGSHRYNAKLNEATALQIKRLLAESGGKRGSRVKTARQLGIGYNLVKLVAIGNTWAWLKLDEQKEAA
jgi:hypothetical protein